MAFCLPLALYVVTLAPTVYNLDSAELTTAAATGGLVRATGYPLYLLLGQLCARLPLGDVGFRLNLLSALAGAATVALGDRILRKLGVGPWARFGALGLLACAQMFWALSLIAEVYSLHTALMTTILLLLLRWSERPSTGRLAQVGFAVGLSLGHHLSTSLLLPACGWFWIAHVPAGSMRPRALLIPVLAVALGLSVYLYLPWLWLSQPAFNYVGRYNAAGVFVPRDLCDPRELWWLASGRAFSDRMTLRLDFEFLVALWGFVGQLWRNFLPIGIGPGVLGLIVLIRRSWAVGGMLIWMFIFNVGFYANYDVVDRETMYLPAYVVWMLWIGLGYQRLLDWTGAERHAGLLAHTVPTLLRAAIAGSVLYVAAWNWPLVDLSDDWSARVQGERLLYELKPNALLIGSWDKVPLVEYFQLVEGRRPDVQAINLFLIDHKDALALILRELRRRPIYVDRLPSELKDLIRPRRGGLLYELQPLGRAGGPGG